MLDDVMLDITKVGMLAFVVAGTFAMGIKLTVASVIEPLKNACLLVPLLVTNVLPMDNDTSTALILVAAEIGKRTGTMTAITTNMVGA